MAVVDLDQDRRNKYPRILTENERERLDEYIDQIHYSSRYLYPFPVRITHFTELKSRELTKLGLSDIPTTNTNTVMYNYRRT